jgi:hypothetical protein
MSMSKSEAQALGYCNHCAAYGGPDNFRCGVAKAVRNDDCILPAEAVARWQGEFGLEGATRRFTGKFGDRELIGKKRGRKAQRYLK